MYSTKLGILVLSMLLNLKIFLGAPAKASQVICVQQPRDLFLVVDDSASIGHVNIRKVRSFLQELVSNVHVAPEMTRVGLLQFSDEEHILLRFNLHNNFTAETLREKFENMEYFGGSKTMTDLALKMVAEKVFTKTGGDRPDVPDVMVVFTDGKSRRPELTVEQAQVLKDRGVRIIAIGAGEYVTQFKHELYSIASSPGDVEMVDNFEKLQNIVVDIVNKVCEEITTPKPPTQPTQGSQFQPNTNKPTTRMRAPAPSHRLGFLSHWVGSTSTPAPSTTLAPIGCAGSVGKDILFLVDGTANSQQTYHMVDKDFKKIKRFIRGIVRDLNDASFRIGVMQFAKKGMAHMEIDFMNPINMKEIKLSLNMIVQQRGHKRYTGDALVEANKEFYKLDANSHRENNPNVVVLITRGLPMDKDHTTRAAMMLEARNVRLVTVGVGSSTRRFASFLKQITYPQFVVLSKYNGLRRQRVPTLEAMCVKASYVPKPGLPRESAECRRDPHDIFFVIDGSASIKHFNFGKVQIFLMDLVSLLRVEQSNINTGLMQFSEKGLTSMIWDLGRYSEFETIMNIRNMTYQAGLRTQTGDALTRVNNEVFTGRNGDRPGVMDILILFTDGNAHDVQVAREQADILKNQKGVLVVTIGAGTESSLRQFEQELQDMASGPEYALTVNFDELDIFAEKAFPLVCSYLKRRRRL